MSIDCSPAEGEQFGERSSGAFRNCQLQHLAGLWRYIIQSYGRPQGDGVLREPGNARASTVLPLTIRIRSGASRRRQRGLDEQSFCGEVENPATSQSWRGSQLTVVLERRGPAVRTTLWLLLPALARFEPKRRLACVEACGDHASW